MPDIINWHISCRTAFNQ